MTDREDESGRPIGSCNCAPNSGAHECPVHTQEDWLSASTGHSPSRLCEPPEPVGVHPRSALNRAEKSGHYVSDPEAPCWCGDVHHYAATPTTTEEPS